jgi:hypothetical protein
MTCDKSFLNRRTAKLTPVRRSLHAAEQSVPERHPLNATETAMRRENVAKRREMFEQVSA